MICNQQGECFARTAAGKCGILTGSQYPPGKCKFQKAKSEIESEEERFGNPMVNINVDLIERIREGKGISSDAFSCLCGMSHSWWSARVKAGSTTFKSAQKIADFHRLDVEEIIVDW